MNIKLKATDKIKAQNPAEIFLIMQKILLKEEESDRKREHFWTVSLDWGNTIVNIELVSLGTWNETLVKPMEVLSIPLQKKAVKIILVHNHPSGNLEPSEGDKDVTDRLIQACNIMQIEVTDHLIISENSYYSFGTSGLMDELRQSTKYVPTYILQQRYEKVGKEKGEEKGRKARDKEIILSMRAKGLSTDEIAELTGIPKATISRIKD